MERGLGGLTINLKGPKDTRVGGKEATRDRGEGWGAGGQEGEPEASGAGSSSAGWWLRPL